MFVLLINQFGPCAFLIRLTFTLFGKWLDFWRYTFGAEVGGSIHSFLARLFVVFRRQVNVASLEVLKFSPLGFCVAWWCLQQSSDNCVASRSMGFCVSVMLTFQTDWLILPNTSCLLQATRRQNILSN